MVDRHSCLPCADSVGRFPQHLLGAGHGIDGGGPQPELVRRVAHWLMKEPDLEEIGTAGGPGWRQATSPTWRCAGIRPPAERPLLDPYQAILVAHGVQVYDRRALADDYRLSVLFQILVPVSQAAIYIPPAIWRSHRERITLAVDDLGCRELLD